MYRKTAREAGAADAAEHFGLNHGTPKPPSTWSRKWQESEVKKVQKKVTIPSMSEVKVR